MNPTALWVCPVSNLAGVARHIIDVARVGLPGYRLVVTAPEGPLLEELRKLGCPVVALEVDAPVPTAVRALRRTIRRLRPAVVHSHLAKADFLAAMAAQGLDVRLVSTEHHIPQDPLIFHGSRSRAATRQLAHRARLRRFDALIAVSDSTKRDMLRWWRPTTAIHVIRNGADPLPRHDRSPGLRILSLTRLSPEKNLDMTLRVFALVHAQHPQARLTVAGDGPERARLEAMAADLGLATVVTFAGFVDPVQSMAEHDVLVQPSRADNLSYTLIDAVNQGMGVVASDIGGNPELLPVQCLASLHDDQDFAEKVVQQGFDAASRPPMPATVPSVAQMAAQVTALYASVVTRDQTDTPEDTSGQVPDASVIIAYYRNADTLGAQLDGLSQQVDAPPFEVIVADNEGSPQLRRLVDDHCERLDLRIVLATGARGQCHARNIAVSAARGRVAAFCDADDIVGEHWLRAVTQPVFAEDVVATGPLRLDRINPPYAWRTYLGAADAEIPTPVLQQPFAFLGYEKFAIGCNLAVRVDTYRRLGGMNEDIRGGSEDVDFSWRAVESGLRIVPVTDAVVDYRLRTSSSEVFRQRRGYQVSQLRLWAISRELGRPVRGMSLRWAMTETAKLPSQWMRVRHQPIGDQFKFAARAGAVVGNLEGQIRERVVRRTS